MVNQRIQPLAINLTIEIGFGFRSELLIAPADDLSIRITADYDEYDETCCVVGSTAYGAANQVAALLGGQVIPNNPFSQTAFFTFDPVSNGENAGLLYAHRKKTLVTPLLKALLLIELLITTKCKMLILMQRILLLQAQSPKSFQA